MRTTITVGFFNSSLLFYYFYAYILSQALLMIFQYTHTYNKYIPIEIFFGSINIIFAETQRKVIALISYSVGRILFRARKVTKANSCSFMNREFTHMKNFLKMHYGTYRSNYVNEGKCWTCKIKSGCY